MKRYIISLLCILSVSGIAYGQGKLVGGVTESLLGKSPEILINGFDSGIGSRIGVGSGIIIGSSITGANIGSANDIVPDIPGLSEYEINKELQLAGLKKKARTNGLKITDKIQQPKSFTFEKNSKWDQLARKYPSPRKVVVSSAPAKSLPDQNNQEVEGETKPTSQDWKEGLRKRVYDKIHKINTMETKGDLHMIYGHIIMVHEDGEYNVNYAA